MRDATSQNSELRHAVAPQGPQATAGANAVPSAGPSYGQASGGWDPFEVWLHLIEQPRQRRTARPMIRSIP